jgi:DNA repair protein RadC
MKNLANQLSEITVSYNPVIEPEYIITSSFDAYTAFLQYFPSDTIRLQERFVVMYLNRSNKVLGLYPVSVGGITGTVADPRLILGVAVKVAATAIILAHNHPSGATNPSQADIDLTLKIKEACRYLDIQILDHLILSSDEENYYSMADSAVL